LIKLKETIQQKVLLILQGDYLLWCRHHACGISCAGWKPAPQKIDFLPFRLKERSIKGKVFPPLRDSMESNKAPPIMKCRYNEAKYDPLLGGYAMKMLCRLLAFAFMFTLANCVSLTVNVYFPTTEIKKAAEEIEERVRSGVGAEGLKESSFVPDIMPMRYALHLSIGLPQACAEEKKLDIDISTPAFKKIIQSRTKRYKDLEEYLNKGSLGEGIGGYLAIRESKGLELKVLTTIKKLMMEENKDREDLYKEILSVNKAELSKENIARAGVEYAETIRKKLAVGQWYEIKEGEKSQWMQMTKEEKEKIEKAEKAGK